MTDPLWVYIPINSATRSQVEQLKNDLEPIFRAELSTRFTDFASLSGTDIAEVITGPGNRSKINRVYKAIFGSANNASMCVYSGLNASYPNINVLVSSSRYLYDYSCGYGWRHRYRTCNEACLYTGDSNLIDFGLTNRISAGLGALTGHIGLMQIPHHGSIHNSDLCSFSCPFQFPRLFVSYGTTNTFGHLSTYLLGNLRASGRSVIEVTEKKDTTLSQCIQIWQ